MATQDSYVFGTSPTLDEVIQAARAAAAARGGVASAPAPRRRPLDEIDELIAKADRLAAEVVNAALVVDNWSVVVTAVDFLRARMDYLELRVVDSTTEQPLCGPRVVDWITNQLRAAQRLADGGGDVFSALHDILTKTVRATATYENNEIAGELFDFRATMYNGIYHPETFDSPTSPDDVQDIAPSQQPTLTFRPAGAAAARDMSSVDVMDAVGSAWVDVVDAVRQALYEATDGE